jgi:hypothetical protein
LKGVDGETVVSIQKIETSASLWSIVRGKTGFGAGPLSHTLYIFIFEELKTFPAICLDMHLLLLFDFFFALWIALASTKPLVVVEIFPAVDQNFCISCKRLASN